jgi:N-acetylneuraminic acid mutarotase
MHSNGDGRHSDSKVVSLTIITLLTVALFLFSLGHTHQACTDATPIRYSSGLQTGRLGYAKVADSPAVGQGRTGQADAGSDVVNGCLYVVGGYGYLADDRLDAVSVYSPADNTWSAGPPYPVRAWGIACSAIRASLFCFGGNGAGLRAYRLDTKDSLWTRLKDMPNGYNNSQGHVVMADPDDNQVFVMGSSSNTKVNRTTLAYDIVHDSYTKKSDMPYGNGWFTAAIYQGRIYTISGTHGNEVSVYDVTNDTWSQLCPTLPGPSRFGMIRNPGVISGLVPIIDGRQGGTGFYNLTYFYDVTRNRFMRGPDTLLARDGIAGGIVGSTLYVFGGRNDQNAPRGLTLSEKVDLGSLVSSQDA